MRACCCISPRNPWEKSRGACTVLHDYLFGSGPILLLTSVPPSLTLIALSRCLLTRPSCLSLVPSSHRPRDHDGQEEGLRDREESGENAQSPHMWTYDKIAANPSMASAFRTFANRALCQESVWFLEEVSRCGSGGGVCTTYRDSSSRRASRK